MRNKPVAWTLLGIGAVATVVSALGMMGAAGRPHIPAWLPAAIGVGSLGIGWGVTMLLVGTPRRVMKWIMGFNTAWVLVVGTLLTFALLRVPST
jgi:hypothetical protein